MQEISEKTVPKLYKYLYSYQLFGIFEHFKWRVKQKTFKKAIVKS